MKSAFNFAKKVFGYIGDPDIIKPLIATMLGVFLAFMLNDYWHKINSVKTTKDRLHLVCLEAGYNAALLKEALKAYSTTLKTLPPAARPTHLPQRENWPFPNSGEGLQCFPPTFANRTRRWIP